MSSDVPDGLAPVAVILTQVAIPEALAGACALERVAVDVVPTAIGCVAVCRGSDEGVPEAAAHVISAGLGASDSPVVLLVQRDGQMSASMWRDGERTKDLSAALALDGAPAEVERLLLGQVRAADLPGMVTSAGVGRLGTLRLLGAAGKAQRALRRGGRA